MRKHIVGLACLLALVACDSTSPGERFFAVMNTGNELPPLQLLSSGTVNFTSKSGSISYTIIVQNITGVSFARIYAGDGSTNGTAVADLYTGPITGAIANGVLVSGTLTAAGFASLTMDSALVLMRKGVAYVNVATVSRPGGEIRGQILLN